MNDFSPNANFPLVNISFRLLRPTILKLDKVSDNELGLGSTVVELTTSNPKIKGSNPASLSGRENLTKKFQPISLEIG